jgi:hypothetical protein
MRERYFIILVCLIIMCLSANCSKDDNVLGTDNPVTFEIYLSANNLSGTAQDQLDGVELIEPPFLTLSDISGYNWDKHLITYPKSVWDRLKTIEDLWGKCFVVTVDGDQVYWGRFSSSAFISGYSGTLDNTEISLISDTESVYESYIPSSILIEQSHQYYDGPDSDRRNNLRIHNTLTQAGKLVEDDAPYPVPPQKEFSIHLTSHYYPEEMGLPLDEMTLLEPHLLTTSDIICYNWGDHYISFTYDAWKRMELWGDLYRKIFVVCVGDERIYKGHFSFVSGGLMRLYPTIYLKLGTLPGKSTTPGIIRIYYPEKLPDPSCAACYHSPDSPRIRDALDKAGVLVVHYK